ncbi:unnamed protein product [Leuciscus chuanchicus]
MLQLKEDEPSLKVKIDIREDMEGQEGRVDLFSANWKTATIVLEDVADIDFRLAIDDDSKNEKGDVLSEDQKAAINQLALSWDLPVLTATNRTSINLLQHAKEEEEEDFDEPPFSTKCRIAGYLWQFVETVLTTRVINCSETPLQKPRNLDSRGDEVMADRGFTITDLLYERKVKLVLPAFTKRGMQLSEEDTTNTRRIANVRVHVEQVGLSKVYTNHSLRSTAVGRDSDAGLESRQIMSVAGRRCESSPYWAQSVRERRDWSNVLSASSAHHGQYPAIVDPPSKAPMSDLPPFQIAL